MDTVTMLRDLWRHRNAVVAVMALSVIVGVMVLYKFAGPLQLEPRKYSVGIANTRVLIDTPSSQVAAIAPEGSGDLGMRADLLSRIMVEGTVKAKIAERAGLHPNALFGVSQSAESDLAAPTPPRDAPVLTTQVVVVNYSTQLPLVEIEAQAGDAALATRIADAAVKGLRDYVDKQAADGRVPDQRRVRVTPLGETRAETVVRGPKAIFALIAGIFVFALGCAFLLGIAAVARSSRRTTPADQWWRDEDVDPLAVVRAGAEEPEHEHVAPVAVSPLRHTEPVPTSSVSADQLHVADPPADRGTRAPRRRRSAS